MPKRKFSGKLGKRIKPRNYINATADEQCEWLIEDAQKLNLLCAEYGIENNEKMWMNLAVALAKDFVPGYQEEVARGPKQKWTEFRKQMLVVDVERTQSAKGCSVLQACESLACREPWKNFVEARERGDTPNIAETLKKKYKDFKGELWAKVARDAYRYHEAMGTEAEWEEFARDNWGE